jgi:hypothetical protein
MKLELVYLVPPPRRRGRTDPWEATDPYCRCPVCVIGGDPNCACEGCVADRELEAEL